MPRRGYHLGVDLGTTFTAAAVARDGRVEVVALGTQRAAIPSVVLLRPDGTWLVGEAADRRATTEPERVAREFKRRFGDPVPVLVAGSPQSAEALTGRLLAHVVEVVAERMGGPPASITITHPANWHAFKVDQLRAAVRLADLRLDVPVGFCTEPEAAAVHYAADAGMPVGGTVAVYDLGGGTFDAAVLRRTADGFEPLGHPEGIDRLGGIDVDAAVLDHVRSSLAPGTLDVDSTDAAALGALAALRREVVAAKEALSSDSDATIDVALPTSRASVRITRAELESRVRPMLGDTTAALGRALRSAGLTAADLDAVLLVGGSSRMPVVSEVVAAQLGVPVAVDADPKHAVALGAAGIGAARAGPDVDDAPTPPSVSTPPRSPSRSRRGPVIGAVVAAATVAVVGAIVLGGDDDDPEDAASTTTAPPTTSAVVPAEPLDGIVFSSTADGDEAIWLADADGSNPRKLLDSEGIDHNPTLSNDRTRIVYSHADDFGDERWEVWIMDVDGTDRRFVAETREIPRSDFVADDAGVVVPTPRPDGDVHGEAGLAVVDLATGETTAVPVAVPGCSANDPAVSPDGERVAYRCTFATSDPQVQEHEVVVSGLDGGDPRQLTFLGGVDTDPAWSTDGTLLFFTSERAAGLHVWQMGADGSDPVPVTADPILRDQDPLPFAGGLLIARDFPDGNTDIVLARGDTVETFVGGPGYQGHPSG